MPPSDIKVIGGFALGACVRPDVCVDVAVILPEKFLAEKDHLNQRYFVKRALYLCSLAAYLKGKSDLVESLEFSYRLGDALRPVLVLAPPGKLSGQFTVRLHVAIDSQDSVMKLNRFHVSKNNVRSAWYSGSKDGDNDENEAATPHYNAAVLADLLLSQQTDLAVQALQGMKGLLQGIALVKVWLQQRQLTGQGVNGFLVTMLVVWLLRKKKLNANMTNFQVLRNVLVYLSQADWCVAGISLLEAGSEDDQKPTMEEFHAAYEVVFVDNSGYMNLTAALSAATFKQLQHEAGRSVATLETPGVDAFTMLLMTPVPFLHKFDMLIHVNMETAAACVDKFGCAGNLADRNGDAVLTSLPRIYSALSQSLAGRVALIALRLPAVQAWTTTSAAPSTEASQISFGLLYEGGHGGAVERGPPADSPEATKFQSFWGERSELRRFADGAICEAVVWPARTLAERRQIPGKIAKHVLERHAGLARNHLTVVSGQIECVLNMPKRKKGGVSKGVYGTGEEQHSQILQTMDDLTKTLRSLDDLPLAIHSVQGADDVYRYASVFPPLPTYTQTQCTVDNGVLTPDVGADHVPAYLPTVTIQCLLEGSGKWPEDKGAVRRLRAAFHLRLASLLAKTHKSVVRPNAEYVDVFQQGYVFRVKVGYLQEITLLKTVRSSDGKVRIEETAAAKAMHHSLVTLPRLASTLRSQHQQHNSYCSAIRLCHRWVSAQLLSGYIRSEVIEMLVTSLYICPAPFTVPSTPQAALLRFLNLISTHDWNNQPLLVNLNNEFTLEDLAAIPSRFSKERSTLPLMFISTPLDKWSAMTRGEPPAPILHRLILLAKESLRVLHSQLESTSIDMDFRQIFRAPLEHFDLVLHLNVALLPRHYQAVDVGVGCKIPDMQEPAPENKEEKKKKASMPVVNFDPATCFLSNLQEAYGDIAAFFHDPHGGHVIGVLWKPSAKTRTAFRVSNIACRALETSSDGKVELMCNMPAIMEDMKSMGAGLLKEIHTAATPAS